MASLTQMASLTDHQPYDSIHQLVVLWTLNFKLSRPTGCNHPYLTTPPLSWTLRPSSSWTAGPIWNTPSIPSTALRQRKQSLQHSQPCGRRHCQTGCSITCLLEISQLTRR